MRAILDELKRPWTPITEAQSLKTLAPADGKCDDYIIHSDLSYLSNVAQDVHDNNSAALVGQMFDKISSTLSAALQSQHIELSCYFKLSCCSSVVLMNILGIIAQHATTLHIVPYPFQSCAVVSYSVLPCFL